MVLNQAMNGPAFKAWVEKSLAPSPWDVSSGFVISLYLVL
jgi:hypothetical protein